MTTTIEPQFEDLNPQRPFIKARSLKKGDSITGYVLSDWKSEKYPEHVNLVVAAKGPHNFTLVAQDKPDTQVTVKDGQQFILQGAGNLKYFFKDNELGFLYRFIYEGMITQKKGKAAGKESHYFRLAVAKNDKFTGELPGASTDPVAEQL